MADTLESLEIEVRHSATGAADEINSVANAIRSVSRALAQVIPRLSAFNEALGGHALTVNNNDITQLAGNIANVGRVSIHAGRAASDAARGVSDISGAAKKANGPLSNFLASLKRIAFYRFIRTIIKEITEAFSQGLEWAYKFSAGISGEGNRFAAAMDSMKSATTQMKAQIGSAFIGLLTIIEPVLERIISVITAVANAMAQFFAVFTGGTYLKATETSQKFADNMKSGGSAAKEWKNQLLGFDVINRLNEPSGGGGGGGKKEINPRTLFKDTEIDGIFKKIKAKLDELKKSLDFSNLIAAWENLKKSVKGFADLVGSALLWAWDNVLVPLAHWVIEKAAPVMLNLLAAAINFLETALEKLQPVFQWAWDNIFVPLAEWTGELVLKALESLTDLLNELIDLLNGNKTFKEFINDLSFMEEILLAVGVAIVGIYTGIGMYNVVTAIATLVTGGFSAALTFLAAHPIVIAIAGIALLIVAIIELIKHWDEIKEAVISVWNGVKDTFRTAGEDLKRTIADIKNAFSEAMNGIKRDLVDWWQAVKYGFASLWKSILQGLSDWWSAVKFGFALLWTNIINGMISFANAAINILNAILAPINAIISFFGGGGVRVPTIPARSIPRYADGGFPSEDGLFFANHSELVGKFANGSTAVANNEQIIEGIKRGVMEALMMVEDSNGSGKEHKTVLNIDGREFFRAIWDDYKAVARERGMSFINT